LARRTGTGGSNLPNCNTEKSKMLETEDEFIEAMEEQLEDPSRFLLRLMILFDFDLDTVRTALSAIELKFDQLLVSVSDARTSTRPRGVSWQHRQNPVGSHMNEPRAEYTRNRTTVYNDT